MAADPQNFYALNRAATKILVVDFGFLGDALHLVPALWEIKRHYPDAALHVTSSPLGAEALRLAPCVDRIWPVELNPQRRKWTDQWHFVRALRREKFDAAFALTTPDRVRIVLGLSGARRRVARSGGRQHFWNQWLANYWTPAAEPDLTVFEQHRQTLAACGFTLQPVRFDLRVDDASVKWAENIVTGEAIHISLNSANPLKEWPLEHYAAMLAAVWRKEPQVRAVVTAGPGAREQERLRQFMGMVNDLRLLSLPETPTIAQLAALLRRCCVHVGPDSGVVHLAMALGVPTVSFFRDQKGYKSWLPVGGAHEALTVSCHCVDHVRGDCLATQKAECLAGLEPARVASIVLAKVKA